MRVRAIADYELTNSSQSQSGSDEDISEEASSSCEPPIAQQQEEEEVVYELPIVNSYFEEITYASEETESEIKLNKKQLKKQKVKENKQKGATEEKDSKSDLPA